jgi:hypothetical protein
LFRTFAETAPTRPGVKAFADRYGALGLEPEEVRIVGDKHEWTAHGERLSGWEREIRAMREAVHLWDAARHRLPSLSRLVRWARGVSSEHQQQVRAELQRVGLTPEAVAASMRQVHQLQSTYAHVEVLQHDGRSSGLVMHPADMNVPMQPDDLSLAGWTVLLTRVTLRLNAIAVALIWNPVEGEPILQLRPQSLLDALWLQLARAITGNREYRQCANPKCCKWFEVTGERRIYCPDRPSCKVEAWRERKRPAKRKTAE